MPIQVKPEPSDASCVNRSTDGLLAGIVAAAINGGSLFPRQTPPISTQNKAPGSNMPPSSAANAQNTSSAPGTDASSPDLGGDATQEDGKDVIDMASIKGIFGWTEIDRVSIPYIFRNDKKLVAVRIVEVKLLRKYPNSFPGHLSKKEPLTSFFITTNEARLLNEINMEHCGYEYGRECFTTRELIVYLTDFIEFYNAVKATYERKNSSSSSSCGWIQINNTVSPYLIKEGVKFIPLPVIRYAAGLLTDIQVNGIEPTEDECNELNEACQVAGLKFEFQLSTTLIPIELMLKHSTPTVLELPRDNPLLCARYLDFSQSPEVLQAGQKDFNPPVTAQGFAGGMPLQSIVPPQTGIPNGQQYMYMSNPRMQGPEGGVKSEAMVPMNVGQQGSPGAMNMHAGNVPGLPWSNQLQQLNGGIMPGHIPPGKPFSSIADMLPSSTVGSTNCPRPVNQQQHPMPQFAKNMYSNLNPQASSPQQMPGGQQYPMQMPQHRMPGIPPASLPPPYPFQGPQGQGMMSVRMGMPERHPLSGNYPQTSISFNSNMQGNFRSPFPVHNQPGTSLASNSMSSPNAGIGTRFPVTNSSSPRTSPAMQQAFVNQGLNQRRSPSARSPSSTITSSNPVMQQALCNQGINQRQSPSARSPSSTITSSSQSINFPLNVPDSMDSNYSPMTAMLQYASKCANGPPNVTISAGQSLPHSGQKIPSINIQRFSPKSSTISTASLDKGESLSTTSLPGQLTRTSLVVQPLPDQIIIGNSNTPNLLRGNPIEMEKTNTSPPKVSCEELASNIDSYTFCGKSISCLNLSSPNRSGRFALVEAVCKLYFSNLDMNEFLYGMENVLKVPLYACTDDEEKAFIQYYGLPVALLKCNKMLKIADLESYYPQLTYMFGKNCNESAKETSPDKPQTKQCDGSNETSASKAGQRDIETVLAIPVMNLSEVWTMDTGQKRPSNQQLYNLQPSKQARKSLEDTVQKLLQHSPPNKGEADLQPSKKVPVVEDHEKVIILD